MKKSDLKTGMQLKRRNGEMLLVMLNKDRDDDFYIVMGGDIWGSLTNYNEDLTPTWDDEKDDIVAVYSSSSIAKCIKKPKSKDIIWERTDMPEYTMSELGEKVGHNFKIKNNGSSKRSSTAD
ncbi:hypothetical protein [uncultured Mediterranean phage]|nr:hypothetical protein [uncultured Mediterranean phage]